MKRLLLTAIASFTILYSQAQCQADFSYMQNGPTTVFTDLSTMLILPVDNLPLTECQMEIYMLMLLEVKEVLE
mgnify:CR=1 FL=1